MSDKNKIGSTEGGGITGLAGWAGLGCHKDTIIHSQAWNTHSIVLVAGSLLVRLRGLFAIKLLAGTQRKSESFIIVILSFAFERRNYDW